MGFAAILFSYWASPALFAEDVRKARAVVFVLSTESDQHLPAQIGKSLCKIVQPDGNPVVKSAIDKTAMSSLLAGKIQSKTARLAIVYFLCCVARVADDTKGDPVTEYLFVLNGEKAPADFCLPTSLNGLEQAVRANILRDGVTAARLANWLRRMQCSKMLVMLDCFHEESDDMLPPGWPSQSLKPRDLASDLARALAQVLTRHDGVRARVIVGLSEGPGPSKTALASAIGSATAYRVTEQHPLNDERLLESLQTSMPKGAVLAHAGKLQENLKWRSPPPTGSVLICVDAPPDLHHAAALKGVVKARGTKAPWLDRGQLKYSDANKRFEWECNEVPVGPVDVELHGCPGGKRTDVKYVAANQTTTFRHRIRNIGRISVKVNTGPGVEKRKGWTPYVLIKSATGMDRSRLTYNGSGSFHWDGENRPGRYTVKVGMLGRIVHTQIIAVSPEYTSEVRCTLLTDDVHVIVNNIGKRASVEVAVDGKVRGTVKGPSSSKTVIVKGLMIGTHRISVTSRDAYDGSELDSKSLECFLGLRKGQPRKWTVGLMQERATRKGPRTGHSPIPQM